MKKTKKKETQKNITQYPSFTFKGPSDSLDIKLRRPLMAYGKGSNVSLFPDVNVYNLNEIDKVEKRKITYLTKEDLDLLKNMYKDDTRSYDNFLCALTTLLKYKYLSYSLIDGLFRIRINVSACVNFLLKTSTPSEVFTNAIFEWDFFKEILHTAALLGYLKTKNNFLVKKEGKESNFNIELCGIVDLKEHLIDSKMNLNHIRMHLEQEFKEPFELDVCKKNKDNVKFRISEEIYRCMDKIVEISIYEFAYLVIYNDLEMYYNQMDNKTLIKDNSTNVWKDEDERRRDAEKAFMTKVGFTINNRHEDICCSQVSLTELKKVFEKLMLNQPFIRTMDTDESKDWAFAEIHYIESYFNAIINNYWQTSPYTSFFYREGYYNYYKFCWNMNEANYIEQTKRHLEKDIVFSSYMENFYKDYINNQTTKVSREVVNFKLSITFNRQLLSNYYYSNLFTKNILNKFDNKTMNSFKMRVIDKFNKNPLFSAIMYRLSDMDESKQLRVLKHDYSTCLSKSSIFSNESISGSLFDRNRTAEHDEKAYKNPLFSDIDDDDMTSTYFTLMSLEFITMASLSPHDYNLEEYENKIWSSYEQNPFLHVPMLPFGDCYCKHNFSESISNIIWNGTSPTGRKLNIPSSVIGFSNIFYHLIHEHSEHYVCDCPCEAEEDMNVVFKFKYITDNYDNKDWFNIVLLNFRNLITKLYKAYISLQSAHAKSIDSFRKVYDGNDAVVNKLSNINSEINRILDDIANNPEIIREKVKENNFLSGLMVSIANLYSEFNPDGWLFFPNINVNNHKSFYVNNNENHLSKGLDEKLIRLDLLAIGDNDYEFVSAPHSDAIEYDKRITLELFYSRDRNSAHRLYEENKFDKNSRMRDAYNVSKSEYMLDRIRMNYVNPTEKNFEDIKYLKKLERDINVLLNNTSSVRQFSKLLLQTFDNSFDKKLRNKLTVIDTKWILLQFNCNTFTMGISQELTPLSIGSYYAATLANAGNAFSIETDVKRRIEKVVTLSGSMPLDKKDVVVTYDELKGYVNFKNMIFHLLVHSYVNDMSYPISGNNTYISNSLKVIFRRFGKNFPIDNNIAYDLSIASYPNRTKGGLYNPNEYLCDSRVHRFGIKELEKNNDNYDEKGE